MTAAMLRFPEVDCIFGVAGEAGTAEMVSALCVAVCRQTDESSYLTQMVHTLV